MSAADPRSQQLRDLSDCAYRLALAFGTEAERTQDHARKLEYVALFDRCFFSVRVAIGLQLRLRREPAVLRPVERPERADLDLRAERDPSEHEPPETAERDWPERDREGDREAASLRVLLKTLGGVAAAAAALPGPEPAALPSLRELLAQMTTAPPAPAPSTPGLGLRARLAASATAPVVTLAAPARPAPRIALPLRRATGPPRR